MLTIKCFPMNMLEENCYIVYDESNEAVIIDCGAFGEHDENIIDKYIESHELKVVHHLCTHMHYDHCFGVFHIWDKYGVRPEFSSADEDIYRGKNDAIFGGLRDYMYQHPLPSCNQYLKNGDIVKFGSHEFKVLATPGHTPGGVCFYCERENIVFVGDTLFQSSIGRTDFPGGSYEESCKGIKEALFTLPGETIVYCGHGPNTSISFEKNHNPYVR